jgi:DNA-directed RNA polymerase, mitochondrial
MQHYERKVFSHDTLVEHEVALEKEAVGLGIAAYYRELKWDPTTAQPGQALMRRYIGPLAAAIREFTDDAMSGKGGRHVGRARFLAQLPAEDVAFITLRNVLFAFSSNIHMARIHAETLGRHITEAAQSAAIEAADPKAFAKLLKKTDKVRDPGIRLMMYRNAQDKLCISKVKWGHAEAVKAGLVLLTMAEEVTGLFSLVMRSRDKRRYTHLVPSPDAVEWIEQSHQRCAALYPAYFPMVVKPREWTNPFNGGYLDRKGLRVHMVSTAFALNKQYAEELRNVHMPKQYQAVNALQNTPWRINHAVLSVMKEAWDNDMQIAKLPARDDIPIPVMPENPTPEEAKEIRGKMARTYGINERVRSKRINMSRKLLIAEKFAQYPEIYFPVRLDWRGRFYPVPSYINYQSDSTGKALLEYAEGVELGTNGKYWLAVYGANCAGVDKVSFDERIAWIEQHHCDILASALQPFAAGSLWHGADDPWGFLAFCFEWLALSMWEQRGNSHETYVSHLNCGWDGSANGLQNLCAAIKDSKGAALVNMTYGTTPSDVYAVVAAKASELIDADAAGDKDVNAHYWQGKVTRKLAKGPTMTLAYGSKKFGFGNGIMERLDALREESCGVPYVKGNEHQCSVYLAKVFDQVLKEVVIEPIKVMEWLTKVGTIASSTGLPITWTTPGGLLVQQVYKKQEEECVEVHYGGYRRSLTIYKDTGELNCRKMGQALPPNWTHSLDASLVVLTIDKCIDAGVTNFAMVHDSFGTHAGHADHMHRSLREAFVDIYSGNPLRDFRDEVVEQLPPELAAKVPPVPTRGDFDVSRVLGADYFFA